MAVYAFIPQFWGAAVYPLKYEATIKKYAQQYNFDPNFIAAVIFAESTFNPDSTSYVGARGLMQIMPATAAWIATQVNEPNYTAAKLYEPEVSIKFGCFYLRDMANNYNGNTDLALASYNAGSGAVRGWVRLNPTDPLKASSSVSSYVQKINRTKLMYDKIYGNWYVTQSISAPPAKPWYTLPGTWIGSLVNKP